MASNDTCQATIVGRLPKDAEIKDIKKGDATFKLAKFSLACNHWVKGKGDHTSYFDIEAWNGLANVIQQFTGKGKQLLVIGSLRVDSYEDKRGNKRKALVVKADHIQLLGSNQEGSAPSRSTKPVAAAVTEDEIPF